MRVTNREPQRRSTTQVSPTVDGIEAVSGLVTGGTRDPTAPPHRRGACQLVTDLWTAALLQPSHINANLGD
jgi:hypothetical protein